MSIAAELLGFPNYQTLGNWMKRLNVESGHQYLMRELDIDQITPTKLLPNLTKAFLEANPTWLS